MKENTIFNILNLYLKDYRIKIPIEELELQLLSHPSYPSLHSITGVLDHFNIDNMALEVPQNRETFDMLPEQFISFTTIKNRSEFVLTKKVKNGVQIYFENKNKITFLFDEFISVWNGIVVVIEADNIDFSINKEKKKTFVSILFVTSLILLLSIFIIGIPTIIESTHFILSIIGIIISVLIVKHELGFQSETLEKICTTIKTTSCDAVLNSKAASISKNFKLSDISIIYFTGLTLSWLISKNLSQNTSTIILLSLIALPITFYSIYYQYKIVKKWCPLCLGLVSVIWLQGSVLYFDQLFISGIEPSLFGVFILFSSFVFMASLWLSIKPLIKTQNELKELKVAYYKFKRNFTLFDAVYQKSTLLDTGIETESEIVLGNKNGANEIILVTNPSCYYCKQAHSDIENILKKTKDLKVTIRFSVPQDDTNISYKVAQRLLEIYNSESIKTCESALKEAYDKDANLEKWLIKWGKGESMDFGETLKNQKEWCTEQNINFTPALILNEKQFPKEYNRSDLVYFLDDLIEQKEINIKEEEIILN